MEDLNRPVCNIEFDIPEQHIKITEGFFAKTAINEYKNWGELTGRMHYFINS